MNLRTEYAFFAGIWLLVAISLALSLSVTFAPLLIVRFVSSIIVVGYLPGYFLQTTLFPRQQQLTKLERFVVSIALSLALIPVLALILEGLKLGFHTLVLAILLGITCAILGLTSWYQRSRLARDERYVLFDAYSQIPIPRVHFNVRSGLLALLLLFLGIALVAGAADAFLPRPNAQLTEFYTVDAQGSTSDYPKQVKAGDDVDVNFGIVNREGMAEEYHVEIWEENQRLMVSPNIDMQNAQTIEQSVAFTVNQVGDKQQILINLYRDDDSTPYRTLHLWIDVLTA